MWPFKRTISGKILPDHDPKNLKASDSATKWTHSSVCPKCFEDITIDEQITRICLSCGSSVRWMCDFPSAANRQIIRNGKWVKTKRINNVTYIFEDGWRKLDD